MARHRLSPRRKYTLKIPEEVASRVDLALLNPVLGERRYGELSQLVTSLLRQWLDNQTLPTYDTSQFDPANL